METFDGYNLTLHRIMKKSNNKPVSSGIDVVYLQHGLFLSSDAYVLQGPGKDLGNFELCHLFPSISYTVL